MEDYQREYDDAYDKEMEFLRRQRPGQIQMVHKLMISQEILASRRLQGVTRSHHLGKQAAREQYLAELKTHQLLNS